MNIFQRFFAFLRLREAVRKADEAYRLHRRRFYVLPGAGRSLVIVDRNNFRLLKRKGYIPQHAFLSTAVVESFYFTPFANGYGRMSEEERYCKIQQYYSWYADSLKKERKRRRDGKLQRKG